MLPLKVIVCPTDFSRRSMEALSTATELAHAFEGRLIVVHVLTAVPVLLSPPGAPLAFDVPAYQEELEQASAHRLHEFVNEVVPASLSVSEEVCWGDPARQIVDVADEQDADLIVIATRGESGLSRLVTGSVTEKVVRLADVPVLSIQPQEEGETG